MAKKSKKPSKATPAAAEPAAKKKAVKAEATPPPVLTPLERPTNFPVIAIGASAGGLEALERLFREIHDNTVHAAFIVLQHAAPSHEDRLRGILQRSTALAVVEGQDNLPINRETVYVVPPGQTVHVAGGRLRFAAAKEARPIDELFRSLATDRLDYAVGVVLSGTGSDGLVGARAIKAHGGLTMVQSPESSIFDGMPRSVIDGGVADYVGTPAELGHRIAALTRDNGLFRFGESRFDDNAQRALEQVYGLLRARTGHDFSLYKKSTIYRRIERRMQSHQIVRPLQYVNHLRENPPEIELLFKELLIGVTGFFRDSATWDYFKKEALTGLLSSQRQSSMLRAWVPGCSTGEEAYSLAIAFKEVVEPLKRDLTLQIFATDLDNDAIERARQGLYPEALADEVGPERLRRYFVREERGYRIGKEIRSMVVFATQNLIMDPPFTKLDILSCRNLLIYLSAELQKKIIPLFYYSLNPGGLLMLGSAETVGAVSGLFTPLDAKSRIYRRNDQSVIAVPVEFPSSSVALTNNHQGQPSAENSHENKPHPPANLQALVDRVIVQRYAPVGILCNDKGDILYISGRVGKYLEPAVGKANLNIFAMAREGLRYELSSAFTTSVRDDEPVVCHGLKIGHNGGTQSADLIVTKLREPRELRGTVLVIIREVRAIRLPAKKMPRSAVAPRVTELEQELQRAREQVQTTREEMQTSQEELKSTNEELQSTNEELQSTNEELTTSKEEMQSLNEELQTVNHELQAKVDELSRSNNDMKNLLNSTDIATLFLDGDLNVRRFTTPIAKIIKLIPADAGRPITDIASDLLYSELADDAREVLRTLNSVEVQKGTADGRWFVVRIMPYRTLENVIDGVVITFTDASATRTLEKALRDQASQLRQMADSLPNLICSYRVDGSCDYLSSQWLEFTGVPQSAQLGYGWLEQVYPGDRERVHKAWRHALDEGSPLDCEIRIRAKSGTYRWFRNRAVPIRDADGQITKWYGSSTDIDEFRK